MHVCLYNSEFGAGGFHKEGRDTGMEQAEQQMSRTRVYVWLGTVAVVAIVFAALVLYAAQWRPPSEEVERILPESDFPY